MKKKKPYSDEDYAATYIANTNPIKMTLGKGSFAIFYPQDGHMQQLCVETPKREEIVVVIVKGEE